MTDQLKMQDTDTAKVVEISFDDSGKFWLNVDGKCVVRIGQFNRIVVRPPGMRGLDWRRRSGERERRRDVIAPHGADRRFRDRRSNSQ